MTFISSGLNEAVPKIRARLRRHPEVAAAYAFGSMVRRTDRPPQSWRAGPMQEWDWDLASDLDLAILFDSGFPKSKHWDRQWKLYSELGSVVKRELDLVVLNDASLGLAHQILRTGKRIYERPGRCYRREEAQLLIEALDFLPVKELIEKKAIERIKAFRG